MKQTKLNSVSLSYIQAKEGKLSQLVQTPILSSILDAGVIFLLRWSLDDSVDSVVIAAVAALNALLVNQADEVKLLLLFYILSISNLNFCCPKTC